MTTSSWCDFGRFSPCLVAAFLYTFFYVFHLLALRFLVYRPFYASAKELLASVNAASTVPSSARVEDAHPSSEDRIAERPT